MSFAAKTMVNPVSMAANVVPSLFAISKAPHSSPCVSIPFKPFNFHLSCAHFSSLSLPNFLSLTKRKPLLRVVSVVDENNPVVLEEQEQGVEENLNWDAAESDGEVKESDGEGQESGGFVEPPEGSKLYVGNLPYDVDSEKLAMMFEEAGVVELAEVLYRRGSDESRGFGFVTMSTVEEAEKAIEMFHLYNLGGRQLTVNIAAARGTRPERPPRAVDSDPKIYVGNLPWSCDEARLEQLFSEYGKVVSAQLILDRETGRSRGFGFVAMSNESEMNDAIANLDGQSLDGRQLRVNVAMGKKASF